jgi:hypothetical protein
MQNAWKQPVGRQRPYEFYGEESNSENDSLILDSDSAVLVTESAFDKANGRQDVFKMKQNKELIENMTMAVYSSTVDLPVVAEHELKADLKA